MNRVYIDDIILRKFPIIVKTIWTEYIKRGYEIITKWFKFQAL